jgi:hypothetical protein
MRGTVSEDVVRRAMGRIEESVGMQWLSGELRACVEPVLSHPWMGYRRDDQADLWAATGSRAET